MYQRFFFPKHKDKGKGQPNDDGLAYEMEIEKDERQQLKAPHTLITWLNSFKIYLSFKTFMTKLVLALIRDWQLLNLSSSWQTHQGAQTLFKEGHVGA